MKTRHETELATLMVNKYTRYAFFVVFFSTKRVKKAYRVYIPLFAIVKYFSNF